MHKYSFAQWLMFFYIYCFVGWCIESTIVSLDKRKFINRGFLRGPMLPIYGFGAIIILFVTIPFRDNPMMVYISGLVGTTVLEYFTGALMEKVFRMKYWDYSRQKYNFQGRICVQSSLFWGVLSLFLTYVLHKRVERLVFAIPRTVLFAILGVISVIFVYDLVHSFITAFYVNNLLAKMTDIKSELANVKSQISNKVENSEITASLHKKAEKLNREKEKLTEKIGFFKKDFIKAHPTAKSEKFNEALIELKDKIYKHKK